MDDDDEPSPAQRAWMERDQELHRRQQAEARRQQQQDPSFHDWPADAVSNVLDQLSLTIPALLAAYDWSPPLPAVTTTDRLGIGRYAYDWAQTTQIFEQVDSPGVVDGLACWPIVMLGAVESQMTVAFDEEQNHITTHPGKQSFGRGTEGGYYTGGYSTTSKRTVRVARPTWIDNLAAWIAEDGTIGLRRSHHKLQVFGQDPPERTKRWWHQTPQLAAASFLPTGWSDRLEPLALYALPSTASGLAAMDARLRNGLSDEDLSRLPLRPSMQLDDNHE